MTAPESDGSLARALFDADVDATDPEVADRMWSRLAMAHSSWHEQADRLAPWLAARDARVRAEARRDALNEAADAYTDYEGDRGAAMVVRRWLRALAAETPDGGA